MNREDRKDAKSAKECKIGLPFFLLAFLAHSAMNSISYWLRSSTRLVTGATQALSSHAW